MHSGTFAPGSGLSTSQVTPTIPLPAILVSIREFPCYTNRSPPMICSAKCGKRWAVTREHTARDDNVACSGLDCLSETNGANHHPVRERLEMYSPIGPGGGVGPAAFGYRTYGNGHTAG